MKKKVLLKAYCHNNIGDDLFIRIITQRFSDVQFYMFVNPNFSEGLEVIPNLRLIKENIVIRLLIKISRFLFSKNIILDYLKKKSDVIVLIGGSMFWERGNWKQSVRAYTELLSERKNIFVFHGHKKLFYYNL